MVKFDEAVDSTATKYTEQISLPQKPISEMRNDITPITMNRIDADMISLFSPMRNSKNDLSTSVHIPKPIIAIPAAY